MHVAKIQHKEVYVDVLYICNKFAFIFYDVQLNVCKIQLLVCLNYVI